MTIAKKRSRSSPIEMEVKKLQVLKLLKPQRLRMSDIETLMCESVHGTVLSLEREAKVRRIKEDRTVYYYVTDAGERALKENNGNFGMAEARSHSYLGGTYSPGKTEIPMREGAMDYAKIPSLFQGRSVEYTARQIGLEGNEALVPQELEQDDVEAE